MPLIDCKVELSLTWDPSCVLCTLAGASTFTITDAVTLSTEDNAKPSEILSEGFKRKLYWSEYSATAEKSYDLKDSIRESTILVVKELTDCLFLFIKVIIESQSILTEDTSFQE